MSEIDKEEKDSKNAEQFKEIIIICPKCQNKKKLSTPTKIINQSKQLTTVSIPQGLCCEHGFQAFVDKNFKVRGYQQVDFAFSSLEFLDEGEEKQAEIPYFENIVNILREATEDIEILGGAILTMDGKVLYSSIPSTTFSSTIKEFEVRAKKNLIKVNKMFLELKNEEKICSYNMETNGVKFNLILIFSNNTKLGMANLLLKEVTKKVKGLFPK
ncbi:MAG: hypothetical protein JW891_05975 [Candidatus Lokiarchaeota archaeon]|nr:hypothetical protein [Candidatus Lokiarchaeota archaeon]